MIPQQPIPYTETKITYPVYVQPYLKGIRTLYQNGAFQGTEELKLLAKELQDIFPEKVVLDGVIAEGGKFEVFDVVSSRVSFKHRWDTITQIFRDARCNLKITSTYRVNSKKEADDQLGWRQNEGYSGMIYRIPPCYYTRATPENPSNFNPQLLLRIIA